MIKSSLISEGSRNGDLLGTAQRTLGTHQINIGKNFFFIGYAMQLVDLSS